MSRLIQIIFVTVLFNVQFASPSSSAATQVEKQPLPTESEVLDKVNQLEPSNSESQRLEAVKWFRRQIKSDKLGPAVSALTLAIRKDESSEVRDIAVQIIAGIALRQKLPCPLVVIEAMLDRDLFVRQSAGAFADQFRTYA